MLILCYIQIIKTISILYKYIVLHLKAPTLVNMKIKQLIKKRKQLIMPILFLNNKQYFDTNLSDFCVK